MASKLQGRKQKKYAGVAAHLGAELFNVSVEAHGGMASVTFLLARAIGEEGARWSQSTWKRGAIERQLLCEIAVAVQRGNALTMLSGHTKAVRARAVPQRGNVGCQDGEGDESDGK